MKPDLSRRDAQNLYTYSAARNRRLSEAIYATPGLAVLITIRAYRDRPFAENQDLCRAVIATLAEMREGYGCWVSAYCLMPDHLHFVSGLNSAGISLLTFVERFKGKSTRVSWQYGWQGKLWQARYHDHVLRQAEALREVETYVLDNPVRAGLVAETEAWEWSGILDPQS